MSSILINKKMRPNDKCYCSSGKRYKVCCGPTDTELKNKNQEQFLEGHELSCEEVKILHNCFTNTYPDHKLVDVSNLLDEKTYNKIQLMNYTTKTLMVAVKNETNKKVFETRGNKDILIMYRGSFRNFNMSEFNDVVESVCTMIETRLEGKTDTGG